VEAVEVLLGTEVAVDLLPHARELLAHRGELIRAVGRASYCAAPVPEVAAHITGVVWKIECAVGDPVSEGDTVVVLESMKMEMPVEAEEAGTVKEIRCSEGQAVHEGDTLVVLE
jgi:acetyl-CoA carboxylase biotin carboxyl carrier protein